MLLVPPNAASHPHSTTSSSHTGPSCGVDQANNNHNSNSSSSSPGHSNPDSPAAIVIKQQPQSPPLSPTNTEPVLPNGQPHPHMSGLSEAHYPPVSATATASSQPVSGRSPQAPPAPLSAPGTPAPSTPTPAPVTTRPSSGGSASGGSGPTVVTSNSLSSGGGVGGAVTTSGSGGTGGTNTAPGTGGLAPAMPVPGPSVTPSGGSSAGQLPQHHPLLGYVPHGANKILSRNINGTRESGGSVGDKKNAMVAVTSNPCNESELQLYRVLQRANLLNYYDTFISQGDDVQQLCEAGEEEFLEIMALVGMASKPLHVRRLQKALQEWVSNPDSARTMIPAEAMKQRELYSSVTPPCSSRSWGGSSMPTTSTRPTAPYHNQNEGLFLMPLKSPAAPAGPAGAPTSGCMTVPPQLDAFNILSSLQTTYRQHHQQQSQSTSNITQSPRGGHARIPPVAAAAAAAVAAAAPHTAPYQRPQPYPSPENLTARKSPPTGGVAPQPGSVSPTDYRRVLEAAWALRAAGGQQDPRSSPPGGKISPTGAAMNNNNRSTWPSTMSPPSSTSRSPGHHTDTLHNSSSEGSQPFLPGTPVPWFPFLVPVNKL